MCGINGIYGLKDEFRIKDILVHMNASIAHRGPDAQGVFSRGGIGLGHRRLSIIDLTEGGRQPMLNASANLAMVFNGEIYNYKKLKALCKDYPFRTETDSEVILALYQKYGDACFEQLDGMFAVAIWDDERKKLVLARDRMGKKPLYYSWVNDIFIFSSEIRGLLASNLFSPVLNAEGFNNYVQYQTVYSPATILKNVFMLETGSTMTISHGVTETKKFWSIDRAKEKYTLPGPYDKVIKQTRELFFQAVEKRLISDVSLGAFLSGGIDSSSVVAAMARVSGSTIKTFNVSFEDESAFSEKVFAEMVAKKFNTEHQTISLKSEDFLIEIQEGLNAMDHPSTDGLNTYVVSKYTKQAGITVALSGLGGDELFGGYPVFNQLKKWQKFRVLGSIPFPIRRALLNAVAKRVSPNKVGRMAQIAEIRKWNWMDIYPVFRMVLSNREMENAGLKPYFVKGLERNENVGYKLLSEISIAECKTYMENVLLRDADQMSMANALEIRVPFLDKDLVEFVLSLPDDFKPIVPGKKLLIDAMGDLLPEEVWNRKKMGFTFPWKKWINRELKLFCSDHLDYLTQWKLLSNEYISQLKADLDLPENPNWIKVWNLVVLSNWMQKNNIQVE